jgi:endoglycosylceramidase
MNKFPNPQMVAACLAVLFTQTSLAMSQAPQNIDLCLSPILGTATEAPAPLHVDGRFIKDTQGRTVLLRGVNISGDSKIPPFMPITHATMLDPLPDWGINTLRLLFTWEAFEPARCNYDTAYMQYYEQVAQWAEERGLYVIVDFHQDAYSRYSNGGCGEGFPKWAIYSGIDLREPDNGAACEDWGSNMLFDLSHHETWHHFHADTEGARTAYIDMVRIVADHMSDHANVIGYELINEPWGNDDELAALYDDVGTAIRERHPSAILFVPPHALMSSGMGYNNIAKPEFDNFVYSPHFYDAFVIMAKNWLGSDPAGTLDKMARHAASWDVPLLLSEYGAPANTQNVEGYMDALNDWLNNGLHSGTQWNYTPGWRADTKDGWNMEDLSISDDTGTLRANFRPRAYPIAIAGTDATFREDNLSLNLRWTNNAKLGETEVFLPQGFMQGKALNIEGNIQCTINAQKLTCAGGNGISAIEVH